MLKIISLMKKVQQIIALRTVKNSENEKYAPLLEPKLKIIDMLKYMNHHGQNLFTSNPYASYNSDTKSTFSSSISLIYN